MFLNFNLYTYHYAYITIFLCTFWVDKYLLSINTIDKLYRIVSNDFFYNNFYFFWTNLWYLPSFFFIFITIFLIYKNLVTTNFSVAVIIIFTLLNNTIFLNFYTNNVNNYYSLIFQEGLNTLLLNSVNKIHPALLYISTYIFFSILLKNYTVTIFKLQAPSFMILNLIKPIKYLIYISIFTLFLGSWWAVQEGSWGGWWNWDASEVFGLLILYKILNYFHINVFLKSVKLHQVHSMISLFTLLSFYLFMQLNFNLISHNFGFHISKFINTEVSLLNLLFFIFIVTKLKVYKYLTYVPHYLYPIKKNIQSTNSLVFLGLSIIFFITLIMIINDFFWINFTLNFFNFYVNFNYMISIIIISLLTILKSNRVNYLLFYSWNLSNAHYYLYIFLKRFDKFKVIILHYVVFTSLLLTLIYYNIVINNWEKLWIPGLYSNINIVIYDNKTLGFINSLVMNSTSSEGKSFNLNLISSLLVQNFYPLELNMLFMITSEDILTILLFICFTITIILYLIMMSKIIVF